ncbi:MAG TPA: N-acetylglutaminylglutamine synthetase [Kiloniellales bacterium]|nr:N-acetylglutaminylglutamine synthetase [Kiloniellales bacterium]
MTEEAKAKQRLDRRNTPTLQNWRPFRPKVDGRKLRQDVALECGWGRLIFGHTFRDPQSLANTLREEGPDKRDIAIYIRDPHILLSLAPQELFLDPSHTYRLWLSQYRPARTPPRGFDIRPARSRADAEAMERIYRRCRMVAPPADFVYRCRDRKSLTFLVAVDHESGEVVGCVNGVDHVQVFDDPEKGCSLWSLAVDPQAKLPGVGESLARHLAEQYLARGRAYMDISVLHHNKQAIALYEKLGCERVSVFCVKRKNPINEPLFAPAADQEELNPYARIIVDEARRRGIVLEVLDSEAGFFRLIHGGRSITCRESLSELTSAIAMSRCDDKAVTRRILEAAGLRVPAQRKAGDEEADRAFLERYGRVVVKPLRGEQGRDVYVDIDNPDDMAEAIAKARRQGHPVLIEEFVTGQDLRIIVIDNKVVAAAIRRPAEIRGNGRDPIRKLIEKQSRRRAAATGGESRIPLDAETERCVRAAGYGMDDILPEGEILAVRRSANLHTGGTIHDVTKKLHPALAAAAVRAAESLEIPVVGLDFMVADPEQPDYAIIEANERPGLANHEPAPTAERFLDLLFPETARRRHRSDSRPGAKTVNPAAEAQEA